MRQWQPRPTQASTSVLTELVQVLGQPDFAGQALSQLQRVVPAASWSVYRAGARPALLMSASTGVPDTTMACWLAYQSGPHRSDRSLLPLPQQVSLSSPSQALVCHVAASEVRPDHRARVYVAHGMAERVSVVRPDGPDGLLALNLYRHVHQPAFRDAQLQAFSELAIALLALAEKHLLLAQAGPPGSAGPAVSARQRLLARCPGLTPRELDVCQRVLCGLSHDGIAAELGLALPTVKTYRNRAFQRLGIHFRSQLYAQFMV